MPFCQFLERGDIKIAQKQMNDLANIRIDSQSPVPEVEIIRFPVGIFFVRGDRAGLGKDIAEQIKASHNYWDLDSGDDIDLILAGWDKKKSDLVFIPEWFLSYRDFVESESTWTYSGESDLLLLNFDFNLENETGCFAYDEVIFLPIEQMVRKDIVSSIDFLMSQLVKVAKSTRARSEKSVVWEISDKLGWIRGQKKFWEAIRKMFLREFAEVYNDLRSFVVTDMRKAQTVD
jgi:hypothetical protein